VRRFRGSKAIVEERGVAFCGSGIDVAVLWCKVPVRVVERAAVGEQLNTVEYLRSVSICGNAEFGVNGERVVERFGAADASGKGVAVSADEIGDEFGELVVVCWAFVEYVYGCGEYWDVDDSWEAYCFSARRMREDWVSEARCVKRAIRRNATQ